MRAKTLVVRGISGIAVLALALLLASCQGRNPKPTTYTVGGTVSGLTGTGLVLQNNGGNNLPISANGAFTFSTALNSGAAYSVTVLTQPSGQSCTVGNGTGTVSANVTNVAVNCVSSVPPAAPTPSLGFGVKELRFTWPPVSGADFYRLLENPDGASGYTQVATNIIATSYNHTIPVHRRLNASYIVDACNSGGCTGSAPQSPGANLTQAIGYAKASNPGLGDQFGFAVTVSGDGNTLAVGAPNEDSSSSTPNESADGAGAVYVYTRVAGIWSQPVYVKALNAGAGDAFGIAVALNGDGNTLAVGAWFEDSSTTGLNSTPNELAPGAGAAYVFARTAGTWSQQAYVKASNARANNFFGSAVALSGDGNTLAVGASFENSAATGIGGNQTDDCSVAIPINCAAASGAVYVYTRSAVTWTQQAYVKASNTEASDLFGSSVALSGDGNTLAVGAVNESSPATGIDGNQTDDCNAAATNCAAASGAVYVYARTAGNWLPQAYVKASNTGDNDNFGTSIALSSDGNSLAVGAPFEDSALTGVAAGVVIETASGNAAPNSGAVYIYARSGGTWSQQAFVKASNTGDSDNFGNSVALSGDGNALAVGAPFENGPAMGIGGNQMNDCNVSGPNCAAASGAVYAYTRSAGAWSQQAYVKASNTGAVDRFGTSVALNGDGNALAVGAQLEDGSSTGIGNTQNDDLTNAGAAYLY